MCFGGEKARKAGASSSVRLNLLMRAISSSDRVKLYTCKLLAMCPGLPVPGITATPFCKDQRANTRKGDTECAAAISCVVRCGVINLNAW